MARVEPIPSHQPSQDPQETETHHGSHAHALPDVMAGEMSQLVSEHRLDLRGGEARDQRVEEHDALGGPESGEVSVAVAGALRAVHDEKAPRAKPALREQRLDARAQALVRK